MRQYNEKPSKFSNIGQDIPEAARHSKDTYETPEELRKKAFKKNSTISLKNLKNEYIEILKKSLSESTEKAIDCLKAYELKKCLLSCDLFQDFKGNIVEELRSYVLAEKEYNKRKIMVSKYNRLLTIIRKIRYIRPIELCKYFETKKKNQFKEINGHKAKWYTDSKSFDINFLASKTKSVQYGNSLTENERIYVSENLVKSINEIEKNFEIDFSNLGFSYGARGKAGSIAHYQDSFKVLAFNRNWDGALIHELGHAIDYSLDLVSKNMPYAIVSKYREKIRPVEKMIDLNYYMNKKEIFARMFEGYYRKNFNFSSFMLFNQDSITIPDMGDIENLQWFENAISRILKSKKAA